jgi:hypothetical protein
MPYKLFGWIYKLWRGILWDRQDVPKRRWNLTSRRRATAQKQPILIYVTMQFPDSYSKIVIIKRPKSLQNFARPSCCYFSLRRQAVIAGLYAQSPRHFAWQLSARVSETLRPANSGSYVNRLILSHPPPLPTYSLTPYSMGLPEKLTGPLLVKKFPVFYGTRMFITAFTRTRHLSLSWARSI